MATNAEPDLLVDTSVAVALVVDDHEAHEKSARAVGTRTLGLAGHAWFETYSVLTRLPPPARRRPGEVMRVLAHDFPSSRFLDAAAHHALAARLAELGLAGRSVYDALVGAAARHHGCPSPPASPGGVRLPVARGRCGGAGVGAAGDAQALAVPQLVSTYSCSTLGPETRRRASNTALASATTMS